MLAENEIPGMLPLAVTADFGSGFLQGLAVSIRLDTVYDDSKNLRNLSIFSSKVSNALRDNDVVQFAARGL